MKVNIIANFLGRTWSVLIGMIAIPFYIQLLGMEAYGLVGFFGVLLSSLSLLEFGLSTTINRELARFSAMPGKHDEIRDLSRSLEVIYWGMGLVLAIIFLLSSSVISVHWIKAEKLPVATVTEAIAWMGVCLAFQWPISLYNGGLMGLERQISLNITTVSFGTLRAIGSIALLTIFTPSISLFFEWQVFITLLNVFVVAYLFWKHMSPGTRKPKFSFKILKSIGKFTAGMGASGIATYLLSNLDKVILSKILTLSAFGNYNVANTVNNATKMPAASVFAALFPRFAALYEAKDEKGLRYMLHKYTQLVSFIVFPLSATIVFFAYELVEAWSHNPDLASATSLMISVLVIGSALNLTMGILGDLAVASGLSTYVMYQNIVSIILIVPLMLVLSSHYGGLGAAVAWLILNIGYMVISVPILINRTQPGEMRAWYIDDVGKPLLATFAVVGVARLLIPTLHSMIAQILVIGFVLLLAMIACLFVLPDLRSSLAEQAIIKKWLRKTG